MTAAQSIAYYQERMAEAEQMLARFASDPFFADYLHRDIESCRRTVALYHELAAAETKASAVAREQRAVAISRQSGAVKALSGGTWWVAASDGIAGYLVKPGESCTCPDWQYRQPAGGCKHMRAVALVAVEPAAVAA